MAFIKERETMLNYEVKRAETTEPDQPSILLCVTFTKI